MLNSVPSHTWLQVTQTRRISRFSRVRTQIQLGHTHTVQWQAKHMPKHDHNIGHTCTATPNPENNPVTTSGQQNSPENNMSNPHTLHMLFFCSLHTYTVQKLYRNSTVQKLYRNSLENLRNSHPKPRNNTELTKQQQQHTQVKTAENSLQAQNPPF